MADEPTIAGGSILVATGLALEARIATGPGIVTVLSGGDPGRLRSRMAATPQKICAVVSFGLAGGLDPALRAGTVVIATEVVSGEERWLANKAMIAALARRLHAGRRDPIKGRLAGSDSVVIDSEEKAALHRSGAVAVDMESHVAAAFASAHRLPFGVVRVICDPAGRALPPLAQHALEAHGHVDVQAIVRSLARNPGQISALLALGRDFATAVVALRRVRRQLGPGFGLANAGEFVFDVT